MDVSWIFWISPRLSRFHEPHSRTSVSRLVASQRKSSASLRTGLMPTSIPLGERSGELHRTWCSPASRSAGLHGPRRSPSRARPVGCSGPRLLIRTRAKRLAQYGRVRRRHGNLVHAGPVPAADELLAGIPLLVSVEIDPPVDPRGRLSGGCLHLEGHVVRLPHDQRRDHHSVLVVAGRGVQVVTQALRCGWPFGSASAARRPRRPARGPVPPEICSV